MHTISDLADELNRKDWAVKKMLIERGYLTKNGKPRKSTIDDGLMKEDGSIYRRGWDLFIGELKYKNPNDVVIRNKIRDILNSKISDESLLQYLSSQLIDFYKKEKNEDYENFDEDKEIKDLCKCVISYFLEGHTDAFLKAFVSEYETFVNDDVNETYNMMSDDDIYDDIASVLTSKGYNENTVIWARNEELREFQKIFRLCDSFERIFNEAIKKGNDEEIAYKYSSIRINGFEDLQTYPTSLQLGNISEENAFEDLTNWIEEKYRVNVIDMDLDNNIVFFDHDDLIYKGSINWLDEKLEVEDCYLPSDKKKLGL